MSDPILARLEFGKSVAYQAGQLTRQFFQDNDITIEKKEDATPVTEVDRSAELLLRQGIGRAFPNDGIMGEEFAAKEGDSGYKWILDPIDGTLSYIKGVPLYGTMVGIQRNQDMVAGIIYMPILREMVYSAGVEHGCWWIRDLRDEEQLSSKQAVSHAKVSSVEHIDNALLCTTSPDYFYQQGRGGLFDTLRHQALITRCWSDCYAFVLLATGRVDFVVEPIMNPWDIAAAVPIIEGAGGCLTDFSGRSTIESGTVLANNGLLHNHLIDICQ